MKKVLILVVAIFLFSSALTGCGHTHEWKPATCMFPKTCTGCGETEGAVLEHEWIEATCQKAKCCILCGLVQGEPIEHSWKAATCTAPQTCNVCGATEGEVLEHEWIEATCQKAKCCILCGLAQGEPIEHSWSAATCTAPQTCNICGTTEGAANGHSWIAATCTTPKTCSVCRISEGSTIDHNYIDKTCVNCGRAKPQTVVHLYQLEPCSGKNWASEEDGKDIYGNRFDKGLRASIKSTEYLADSKYKQLKMKLIVSDETTEKESLSLKIYADNKLIYDSGTLTYKSRPIEVTLDISNATFIKFEEDWSVDAPSGGSGRYWGQILISDPVFVD